MIHLDTDFLIQALVRGSAQDERLRRWLRAGETLAISAIAWAEFLCGPLDEPEETLARRVISERVPFGEAHAKLTSELFNASGRRRGSLADCMIAAVAIAAGAPLATTNARDYERFTSHGLELGA